MMGRMYRPIIKRVKTIVAAWTAPCLLFRKVYKSIAQMLPAQPLLLFAILYTGWVMILFVMLNKVFLSLESLHRGAIATLPLFFLFTVFFLVSGQHPFVYAGNVAGNADFL